MADVPQKLILRAIEDMVKRNRELHHTQTRAQVSASLGNSEDSFGAHFVRKLLQFLQKKQVKKERNLKEKLLLPTMQY